MNSSSWSLLEKGKPSTKQSAGFLLIKILVISFFMLFASHMVQAQISYSPITIEKKGFIIKKTIYTRADVDMDSNQLLKLFAKDPNMHNYAVPMATYNLIDKLFVASGALLVSFPVFDAIRGHDDPNWKLAAYGAGCLAASIPFRIAFKKKAYKAASYYNAGYREPNSLSLNVRISPTGLGLCMSIP